MNTRVICAMIGLAIAPAIASAQWSDNFDSYPSNVNINGLGGWQGWGNVPAQAPVTSTAQALSAPNSIFCSGSGATGGPGYSDNVHQYSGYNAGQWSFSGNLYVPGNATGLAYFILLNTYADPAGPFDWSVQNLIDGNAGTFSDTYTAGASTPLVRDAWVPFHVDFDLTANTVSNYYNGVLVSTGVWTHDTGAVLNLAAVDLYSDSSSGVYYDNLSLQRVPAPAGLALLGLGGLVAARRRRA